MLKAHAKEFRAFTPHIKILILLSLVFCFTMAESNKPLFRLVNSAVSVNMTLSAFAAERRTVAVCCDAVAAI